MKMPAILRGRRPVLDERFAVDVPRPRHIWSRQIGVHNGQDIIARQLPERAAYLGKLSRTDVLLFVRRAGRSSAFCAALGRRTST